MIASFVYDGLGRREKKTINGSLTEFLYDGLNPVQETSGAAILANILPGLAIDEFLTRTDVVAGVTSNFLTDALGSPIAVTDNSGVVQTEYTYEPFGKTTFTGSSNSNPYQYTGRENDGTALYYYRARYYHPELQRFLSEDPIEFVAGDVNLYSYVWNNPVVFGDPFGFQGVTFGFWCNRSLWHLCRYHWWRFLFRFWRYWSLRDHRCRRWRSTCFLLFHWRLLSRRYSARNEHQFRTWIRIR